MKKFSLGDLWPMLFVTAFGVASIGIPFQILAERDDPIDSVTTVMAFTFMFVVFIPLGVYCIWAAFWAAACVIAAGLLAYFWWGHLKEGMRKEDVLHILGEPTWKTENRTNILGARKTTWNYRYRWFALRGYVEFGVTDTVTEIHVPRGKPEERFPGEFHGW